MIMSPTYSNRNSSTSEYQTNAYKYFIIRGFNRSGTNWVNNLLNLHPKIYCTGEWYFNEIHAALSKLRGTPWSLLNTKEFGEVAGEEFQHLAKKCLQEAARVRGRMDARWLGDRTPVHIEPVPITGASVFFVSRDGRDVLVSWTYQLMNSGLIETMSQYSEMLLVIKRFQENKEYFLQRPHELLASKQWVQSIAGAWNQRVINDLASVQSISAHSNARVFHISYEKLFADTDEQRSKFYEFLDLNPNEADPLDSVNQPGFSQERPGEFYRQGHPRNWEKYFTEETHAWFLEKAHEALELLEYNKVR